MPERTVAEVLAEHRYFVGVTWDRCSCLQRFQSRAEHDAHVEAMLRAAGLLAEGGETVTEWGVRVSPDTVQQMGPHTGLYDEQQARSRSTPDRSVVFRQRTTFPDRVTHWTEP